MSGDKNENNKVVYREVATPLSSYQCPVLNNTNYTLWALRIKKILVANGVWDLVEGTSTSKEIDVKKDSSVFIGIEDVQQAHSQQLKSEFERLVMKEDESIDSFVGKLMSIITKAATCGLTFDEQTKVRKVLNAVPDKFLPIVATIEMIVDFKTVKLEEIIGKLKTYEERIKFRKASHEDNSEKLLLTRQRKEIINTTMEMEDEEVVIRHKEDGRIEMKDTPQMSRKEPTTNREGMREKFGEVSLSERLARAYDLVVAKVNESLCLLEYYNEGETSICGMWTMKDGINKPFTKIYTVKVEGKSVFYRLLGFRNNGEVVLEMEDDNDKGYAVEVYEPSSGHISGVGINDKYVGFFALSYMETLLLLHESNSIIH
ncbi:hypothetical protein Tco_0483526 [Tanacetum coccineum]